MSIESIPASSANKNNMNGNQHLMNLCHTMEQILSKTQNDNTNKIVIFDWDDTLAATTQILTQHKEAESAENVSIQQLHNIGKMVYELLCKYITLYGRHHTFIVTNGSSQWVLFSLDTLSQIIDPTLRQPTTAIVTYFDAIKHLLIQQNITTISAKDTFEKQYPNDTTLWKTLVFIEIVTNSLIKNQSIQRKCSILSIGDSMDEFNASFNAKIMISEKYKMNPKNIILHRIKLKHLPSIAVMEDQIKLMSNLSSLLFNEESTSLTIDYEKELQRYKSVHIHR